MKAFLTILFALVFIFLVKAQDPSIAQIAGKWDIVKDSMNTVDLFASNYSFHFDKDKSFTVIKPNEGQIGERIDESGVYEINKDSIEIKIKQEDGIVLVRPQSITFKILTLTDTILVLQWPQIVENNGLKQYPKLKFKKQK